MSRQAQQADHKPTSGAQKAQAGAQKADNGAAGGQQGAGQRRAGPQQRLGSGGGPQTPGFVPPMVSYGNAGPEVRMLQLLLEKNGLRAGPVDGQFGPQTQRAVIQFQQKKGLDVDGIVGPNTWAALREQGDVSMVSAGYSSDQQQADTKKAKPGSADHGAGHGAGGGNKKSASNQEPKKEKTANVGGAKAGKKGAGSGGKNDLTKEALLRQKILRVAGSQLGITEQGENKGGAMKYQKHFGRGPEPWCADFVSWVYSMAGKPTNNPYCPTFVTQLKKQGKWKGMKDPEPGDLVFFDWQGDGAADHVGIVKYVNGDGSITTIEGNSSNPKNGQEGVWQKNRTKGTILGYGSV